MSEEVQNIISGHSNSFDTGIARALGLNAAIVFQHIVYWLRVNSKKKDAELIEGKYWMYETQKEIASYFEYISEDEVYKAIKKLVESGILIKSCLNPNPFDRTSWYTTSDQSIFLDKPKLKESLRSRQSTESDSVSERNQNPSIDGIRIRQSTECHIHNHNQEKKQKEHHHQDEEDSFSNIDDEEMGKYTKVQLEEAKRVTLEKCQNPVARKKYFKTVLENLSKESQKEPQVSGESVFKDFIHPKINTNVEENIKTAERFIIEKKWGSLFIRSAYVEDKYHSGKDISLNMNPIEFESSLNNLYDSLHR